MGTGTAHGCELRGKIGLLGGGVTYIYQQTSDASVGASKVANRDCVGGDVFHAFLFVSGMMEDLGGFNIYCESAALSVNASHVLVGWSPMEIGVSDVDQAGGIQTAFVWRNGTMQALPSLLQPDNSEEHTSENYSSANGINNAGEIVGETAQLLKEFEGLFHDVLGLCGYLPIADRMGRDGRNVATDI